MCPARSENCAQANPRRSHASTSSAAPRPMVLPGPPDHAPGDPRPTPRPRTAGIARPDAGAIPRSTPAHRSVHRAAHSRFDAMIDRPHQQIDSFETAEQLLHQGQPLVRPHARLGRQPLCRLAGPDHVDPVQQTFLFNIIIITILCESSITNCQSDVLGHLVGSSVLKCEAWDFSLFCRSQSFC